MKRLIALILSALSAVYGQNVNIEAQRPSGSVLIRPYLPVTVPPVRLRNSSRLQSLVRAGALYLTAQDAIALALENNIDLEIARYNALIASWRVVRAEAGGALPGVPGNASQAGAVAAGQGVAGSQAAAGVRIAGAGQNVNQTANATITQIGPITQILDPLVQEASTFSHTTTPQPNNVQSITPVLIANTRAHLGTFQQGFLSGGNATVRYTSNYLDENSPTDVLNPSSATNLSVSLQHNLLRGFGVAVNARTITVAKMNIGISDLQFRGQVNDLVAQVLTEYYSLAAANENVRSQGSAADTAAEFFANVKRQIEAGAVAPPEAVNAELQVLSTRQSLAASRADLQQQEVRLKNLLSRNGTADPLLSSVRIVPVDRIVIPENDDLPPAEELVARALGNRTDIAVNKSTGQASEISALGTRNGVLPNLQAFAALTNAGLAGTPRVLGGRQVADPYFAGGIGSALGQVFRRNFPSERAGAFYQSSLRNRQAQADFAIDQLQLRQTQLEDQKDLNQVEVDVMNSVVALQQARARYAAAARDRILREQLLAGEQKRFALGAAIPFTVVQQQRDLAVAKAAELSALVSWNSARIGLDQTLGTTLEANHISIEEARNGSVARAPSPPVQ